jgi:hypothetical protein
MLRRRIVVIVLFALPLAVQAGDLQRDLKSRWLGAWIVTTTETYSACNGSYTNNRLHGNLVKGTGVHRFRAGELGKVDSVDLHRKRLDLQITLAEPFLVAYRDGPFTLYREAWCRIELEVALDRQLVKSKSADAIDDIITRVLERYPSEEEALDSEEYNDREMEPYPEDYERTLAEHAVWKAEQTNAAVDAAMDHAVEETTRLIDRISDNPDYLAGFAEGVERARSFRYGACPALLSMDLGALRREAAREHSRKDSTENVTDFTYGYQDGKIMVIGLEMIRRLPSCYVPLPELP